MRRGTGLFAAGDDVQLLQCCRHVALRKVCYTNTDTNHKCNSVGHRLLENNVENWIVYFIGAADSKDSTLNCVSWLYFETNKSTNF